MEIDLPPGKYVVAVSGGVDSVTLLHLLHHKNIVSKGNPWKLVIAHLDHGMRSDSDQDRLLVEKLARDYDLPFVYEEGKLGGSTSEAVARTARYNFLHQVRQAQKARSIITAHHQDDLIETAIINLLRGTGRRGLSSLRSTKTITRLLLSVSKEQILEYAKKHQLVWREDSTNQNRNYLRNYVRHNLLPNFSEQQRQQFLELLAHTKTINDGIDQELNYFNQTELNRQWFNSLPHVLAREVLANWLRHNGLDGFDKTRLELMTTGLKTAAINSRLNAGNNRFIIVTKTCLALSRLDR